MSHVPSATTDATPAAPGRYGLWVGPTTDLELRIAHDGVAGLVPLVDATSPEAAIGLFAGRPDRGPTPWVAMLAADRPGRFGTSDAVLLARRWPLMPIVSVAASLLDGRRRTGPPLPGIEEVPWHDVAGRCGWWLLAGDDGLPTSLGLPTAARREERLLATIGGITRHVGRATAAAVLDVAVAAVRPDDLEPLCDMLSSVGHRVATRHVGRPRPGDPAPFVLWDVADLGPDEIEWLRLLVANRPGLFVVLLQSFPRGDTTQAAMRAGAAAVLGKPVSLEAVAGTLLVPVRRPATGGESGLGREGGGRYHPAP